MHATYNFRTIADGDEWEWRFCFVDFYYLQEILLAKIRGLYIKHGTLTDVRVGLETGQSVKVFFSFFDFRIFIFVQLTGTKNDL